MMDVDYFNPCNDRYGHQAGDAALRTVVDVVKQYGRQPFGIAARYGGEEFAIIVHDYGSTNTAWHSLDSSTTYAVSGSGTFKSSSRRSTRRRDCQGRCTQEVPDFRAAAIEHT